MQLYTVVIKDRPVVVISAGETDRDGREAAALFPDNPEILAADKRLRDTIAAMPDDVQTTMEIREVDEAIETWLGEDLQALRANGKPLWDGDTNSIQVRRAKPDEIARWRMSYMTASSEGEEDAAEQSWLTFLVPVTEPDGTSVD